MGTKQGRKLATLPFTMSGTGNVVVEYDFFPTIDISGELHRIYIRQEAGGGATAATFYFFNQKQKATASPSTASHDKMVVRTSAVPLTASATTESLDTPVTALPFFQSSLTMSADVTAVGAWTLLGFVEVEV